MDLCLSFKLIKMERFFLILCSTLCFNCCALAQSVSPQATPNEIMDCLIEVGKDTLPTLNKCESECLNYKFQKRRGSFDFSDKKVVFFTGNTGMTRVTKNWYFNQLKEVVKVYGYIPLENVEVQLVFFDQEDAAQIGCDVAIFVASKKKISKEEAIKRLRK